MCKLEQSLLQECAAVQQNTLSAVAIPTRRETRLWIVWRAAFRRVYSGRIGRLKAKLRTKAPSPLRSAGALHSSGSLQLPHMRPHRLAQGIQIISAFHAGDDAAVAGFARPLFHDTRHLYKVFIAEEQLSQRIAFVCVEPRRYQG